MAKKPTKEELLEIIKELEDGDFEGYEHDKDDALDRPVPKYERDLNLPE